MKYENGNLIISATDDIVDGIVVDSLKQTFEYLNEERTWHPEDLIYNKKIKKALIKVIRHYSTQEDFNRWMDDNS